MSELFETISSTDFLGFCFHSVNYASQLQQAQTKTQQLCGVSCFAHERHVLVQFNFAFLGGSLGCAETQKIVQAVDYCVYHRKHIIIKIASGGVRMQEGVAALHGMSICCASLSRLRASQLVICVLYDPCYGGASASFARAADLVFAETGARIGFAGAEVIKNTIFNGDQNKFDRNVFDGFQRAEKMLQMGQIDGVLPAAQIDECLDRILGFWRPAVTAINAPEFDSTESHEVYDFSECRAATRPQPADYLRNIAQLDVQLAADDAIRIHLGAIDGVRCMFIFTHKSDFTDPISGLGTPDGYRAAGKACFLAGKMRIPVVTLVDTAGALPSPEAELSDQSEALSRCLTLFSESDALIISIITGEGGSGGALAIAAGNSVAALERSFYNVISPEGGVSILAPGVYKGDTQKMKENFVNDCKLLANAQKCYPKYLIKLGVIDRVISGFGALETGKSCEQTSQCIKQYILYQFNSFGLQQWKPWGDMRRGRMTRILQFRAVDDKGAFLEQVKVPIAEKIKIYKTPPEVSAEISKLLRYLAQKSVQFVDQTTCFPLVQCGNMLPVQTGKSCSDSADAGVALEQMQFGDILVQFGPEKVVEKLRNSYKFFVTDTSFRDAHQSILATRLRTKELLQAADVLNQTGLLDSTTFVFSIECWGGATFDTCLRFLYEDPFHRLRELKKRFPRHLTQMLLRGKNAVGYTSYPDNIIRRFIVQSAECGMDVFRVFDAFNDLDQMDLCVTTILESTQKLCEVCVCFSGLGKKYDLAYYLGIIGQIKRRWPKTHIICIKDMAGLLTPFAAADFFKQVVATAFPIPIHYHTHDTSGVQASVIEKAVQNGVKIVDLATDAMAGLSSQPPLQSILHPYLPPEINFNLSNYDSFFSRLRANYQLFEKALSAPSADIYVHQMPGGQISNLRQQCISMGLEEKWEECMRKYAQANEFFGDIIKVTPSSKVVGDLALFMLQNDLDLKDLDEIADFPTSVVKMLEGDLGTPYQDFPAKLKARFSFKAHIKKPDIDFEDVRREVTKFFSGPTEEDLTSYSLYPDVFKQYVQGINYNGPIDQLSVRNFFYGLRINEQITVGSNQIKLVRVHPGEFDHSKKVDFLFNNATITVKIQPPAKDDAKIIMANGEACEVECGVLGVVQQVLQRPGTRVKPGDALFKIVSSKLEIVISAKHNGILREVVVKEGQKVVPGCLLGKVE